jgi:hypothetical protein
MVEVGIDGDADRAIVRLVSERYVHVAENHRRQIPEAILTAGHGELDPDTRIIKMLGARGSHVAARTGVGEESFVVSAS